VDWSESGHSDESLQQRIEETLPKLFERLNSEAGNLECSVNLAGNRLRGPQPIATLLRKLREAKVQVVTLRLHKNQLTDEAMQSVVEHIRQTSQDRRPLLELHLSDNRLTEVGVRKLVEAAHKCRFYFTANSTSDRRCRALWLRCENQRPPLVDPHGLLDKLHSEGLTVCLLPSKEYQPQSGKGRSAQMEAPVHMHHAFAPRSDLRMSQDKGGKSGGKGDWWGGSEGKGKNGDKGSGGKGKGYGQKSGSAENGDGGKAKPIPNYEDHRGKGKAIAESWRNAENYKTRNTPLKLEESGDWKDDHEDDWDDGVMGDYSERIEPRRFELGGARALPLQSTGAHRDRSDQRPNGGFGGSMSSPGQGQQQGFSSGCGGGGMPSVWENAAGVWLNSAAESVRWKVQSCKKLGLLQRSMNPTSVLESEWQAMASLGARSLAQACTQRSSVVVGSFLEEAGVYELGASIAGEPCLAYVFRVLRLAPLFTMSAVCDESNESQCASMLVSVYGELVDAPLSGESNAKENARKVAEWALLDFIFLVGTSRMTSAGLMTMGNVRGGADRF